MDPDSDLDRDGRADRRGDLPAVLTALLSSRVRYKMLDMFIAGEDTPRHARQIAKDTGEHFNSIWQELKHLETLGLLASEKVGSQVRYRTDPTFPLLPELRQLLLKAHGQPVMEFPAVAPTARKEPAAAPLASRPAKPIRPEPTVRAAQPFVIGEID